MTYFLLWDQQLRSYFVVHNKNNNYAYNNR